MTPESDDKSNRTAGETVFSAKKAISSFPGEVGDGRRPRTGGTASSGVVFAVVQCRQQLPFLFPFLSFFSFPSSCLGWSEKYSNDVTLFFDPSSL